MRFTRALFAAGFGLAMLCSSGLTQTSVQPFYQQSWSAGVTDTNGNLLCGTETMSVVPYKGKLYAGTSNWEETNTTQKACQLLVLNSPSGSWQQLYKFTTANTRLDFLTTVTFTTDYEGNTIAPVTMLLAAPNLTSAGTVQVFSLDDTSGTLVAMALGAVTGAVTNPTQTRAMGFHHDPVIGVDLVLAGNDNLGVISGAYNPAATGRIQWQTAASELTVPSMERVMAFAEANGTLYCATTAHIYQRTDGATPTWQSIYYAPTQTEPVGIRGLTAAPNPSGPGQVLLFLSLSQVLHLDPAANNRVTIEQDLPSLLTVTWGHEVNSVLGAYNDFLSYTNAATGELVYLFGFEAAIKPSDVQNNPQLRIIQTPGGHYTADGFYCIRRANTNGISFEVRRITDPSLPTLLSTRTICVSPFSSDQGNVFYFGGFDCNSQPSHDTAWIYRGSHLFGATLSDTFATTAQATPVDIDVLANDPASYSLQSVGPAQCGTTSIVGGKLRYTPNASFLGTDTFTYFASDGVHTASASVSVSVTCFDGSYQLPFNQSDGLTTLTSDGLKTATLNNFTNNPAQWVTGTGDDYALLFDCVTNYVSVDNFTGILSNADRTCAAWVQTTATNAVRPIISWGPNTTGNKWQLNMNASGKVRMETSSGWTVGTSAINDGQWHHVACTFTNNGTPNVTNVQLYVDGTLETVSTSSNCVINTTASGNVKIGGDNQGRFWSGTMADARIYNRALGASEISAIATGATTASPLDWYNQYFPDAPVNWLASDGCDSITLLMKYALGGQPFISQTESALYGGPPVVINDHFRWSIPQRRPTTSTLTYTVQCSRDLANWDVPVNFLGTMPFNSDFEIATYEATPAVSGETKLFLRLPVSLP